MTDELLVLVRREGRLHGLDQQPVEIRRVEVVDRQLVQTGKLGLDELRIALGLEVLVGKAPVSRDLSS